MQLALPFLPCVSSLLVNPTIQNLDGRETSIFKYLCTKWSCQQPWEAGPTISILHTWKLRLIQGH